MANKEHYSITSQNDMYLYSEIINQLEPHSIIDIGMFLKRIGALTRNIKDRSISYDMILDGVDFAPEIGVKIYSKVYDTIESYTLFKKSLSDAQKSNDHLYNKQYDLAFILRPENFLTDSEKSEILEWAYSHAENLVVSGVQSYWKVSNENLAKRGLNVEDLHIDTDEYCLITRIR